MSCSDAPCNKFAPNQIWREVIALHADETQHEERDLCHVAMHHVIYPLCERMSRTLEIQHKERDVCVFVCVMQLCTM